MGDLCCIQKLNLQKVTTDSCDVADLLKLIDIMVGIQSTRDHMHRAITLFKGFVNYVIVCQAVFWMRLLRRRKVKVPCGCIGIAKLHGATQRWQTLIRPL